MPRAFHIMVKPAGAVCNLACRYCFYLDKGNIYPDVRDFRMSDEVLERFTRDYIAAQDLPEVNFAWQGGEPTTMGLDFFRRAIEFQKKHASDKRITNAIQTNGILLNDEWCEFLKANGFLVGLSVDGPRKIHDHYRVDRGGKPSFDRVLKAMRLMKKHGVEFNTLTVVNRYNARHPADVYDFLRDEGSGFMQFIPIVERLAPDGFLLPPPDLDRLESRRTAPWTVTPEAFGEFMCAIFDRWIRKDVGRVFVQTFEVQLGIWAGGRASLCVFSETCGNAMAVEHNGDVYACDHYVYPRHRRGNLTKTPLADLAYGEEQRRFGPDKRDKLPKFCRECDFLFACRGECPKHRFMTTPDGEPGLNWLCEGYKLFFRHAGPYMERIIALLRRGRPASDIMQMFNDPTRR